MDAQRRPWPPNAFVSCGSATKNASMGPRMRARPPGCVRAISMCSEEGGCGLHIWAWRPGCVSGMGMCNVITRLWAHNADPVSRMRTRTLSLAAVCNLCGVNVTCEVHMLFVAAECVHGLWPWRCLVFVVSECDLCNVHVCVRCGSGRVMHMWFDGSGMHVRPTSVNPPLYAGRALVKSEFSS